MKNKKYTKADLDVHIYGRGKNKRFIIYTDFEQAENLGPRWHTRVYPDIEGNQAKAIRQALDWLNRTGDNIVEEPYIIRNSPKKLQIVFNQYKEAPERFFETDEKGNKL